MPPRDPFTGLTDEQAIAVFRGKYHGHTDKQLAARFHVDQRDIYNLRLGRSHAYRQYLYASDAWWRQHLLETEAAP